MHLLPMAYEDEFFDDAESWLKGLDLKLKTCKRVESLYDIVALPSRSFGGQDHVMTSLLSKPSRPASLRENFVRTLRIARTIALHDFFEGYAPGTVSNPLPLPFPILVLASSFRKRPPENGSERIN